MNSNGQRMAQLSATATTTALFASCAFGQAMASQAKTINTGDGSDVQASRNHISNDNSNQDIISRTERLSSVHDSFSVRLDLISHPSSKSSFHSDDSSSVSSDISENYVSYGEDGVPQELVSVCRRVRHHRAHVVRRHRKVHHVRHSSRHHSRHVASHHKRHHKIRYAAAHYHFHRSLAHSHTRHHAAPVSHVAATRHTDYRALNITHNVRPEAEAPPAANEVVRTAYAYRGTPYRFGSMRPGAFDCSGFTKYVYGRKGITIPRTAAEQFHAGRHVDTDKLKPGDLVFFHTTRPGISHVGMYVGNGKFVHSASRKSGGVRVDNLNGYYKKAFRGARRFMREEKPLDTPPSETTTDTSTPSNE